MLKLFKKATTNPFVVAVLIILIGAWPNYVFILNHFFTTGAYLYDAGWFAYIGYQNFWLLNPPVIDTAQGTYLSIHVSLIHVLLSLLSYLFPVDRITWYAMWEGLIAGGFVYVNYLFAKKLGVSFWLAFGGALVFAYTGIALVAATYPHFEMLIVVAIGLFFYGWLFHHRFVMYFGFTVALLTREDAGFHLALLGVSLYFFFLLFQKKSFLFRSQDFRLLLRLSILSFFVSVIMMLAQKIYFGTMSNTLQLIYLGDPLFSHITWSLIWSRAVFYFTFRQYIFLPVLWLIGLAILRRQRQLLLPILVIIPWCSLSLIALSDAAGTLSLYYAFPCWFLFLITYIVTILTRRDEGSSEKDEKQNTVLWCGLLALSAWGSLVFASNNLLVGCVLVILLWFADFVIVNRSLVFLRRVLLGGAVIGVFSLSYVFFQSSSSLSLARLLLIPPSLSIKEFGSVEDFIQNNQSLILTGEMLADDSVLSWYPSSFARSNTIIRSADVSTNVIVYWTGSLGNAYLRDALGDSLNQHSYVFSKTPVRVYVPENQSAILSQMTIYPITKLGDL